MDGDLISPVKTGSPPDVPTRTIFLNTQVIDIVEFRQLPLWKDPFFLNENYVKEGFSVPQIAQKIGCAKSSVIRGLELAGISTRPKYRVNAKEEKAPESLGQYHKKLLRRESVALDKIRNLKKQNCSSYQIAKILNAMNIPTVTGAGKWHPKTVLSLSRRIGPLFS